MKSSDVFVQIRLYNPIVLTTGLVLLFGGILATLILDSTPWWSLAVMILGVLLLLAFLAANLSEVKAAGKKRSTQVRANLMLVAAAMLGIVAALNYIVGRHPVRFDLTANQFYSLSDQTLDVLKRLHQDVNATMFTTSKRQPTEATFRAQQMLEEYGKKSSKFHFKAVDADKEPSEAKRVGLHEYNTVVFESGDNRKDVLPGDYVTYAFQGRQTSEKFQGESAFTAALIKMNDATHSVFYFTQGHGEKDGGSPEADGYKTFKEMLEKENYTIKTLNLLTSTKIPDDATVLAVVGPSKAFQPSETEMIQKFLKQGGKVILCVDPMDMNNRRMITSTGLEPILKDFGVKLQNDFVVDPVSYAYPDPSAVLPQYLSHPIIEKLTNDHINCIIPFSRGLEKMGPSLKDATQIPFLKTTDQAWGETNLKEKPLKYDAGVDTKGPVTLALACEWAPPELSGKKARLVVYGTSSFLLNQFLHAVGNLDLALNTFSWAAEDENKMAIHPKEEDVRVLNLSNVGVHLVFWLTVVILPLSILVAGGFIWYRRRSL